MPFTLLICTFFLSFLFFVNGDTISINATKVVQITSPNSLSWKNITNALLIDNSYATGTSTLGTHYYNEIVWSGFNSNIPSNSIIVEIDLLLGERCYVSNGCGVNQISLQISSANGTGTNTICNWSNGPNNINETGSNFNLSSLWGFSSITPTDLTSLSVDLIVQTCSASSPTVAIDGLMLSIMYTVPSTTQGSSIQTTSQSSQQTTQGSSIQTTSQSNQPTTQVSIQRTSNSNNTVRIALGVVFGLIGLLCIISLLILFILYRRKRNNIQFSEGTPINSNPPKPSYKPSTGYKDVPLSQFLAHISNLLEEDSITQKKKYQLEYSNIENEMNLASAHFNYTTARSEFNKSKNRYENVLAAEHSRVKLSGGPESDYINANYISGLIPNSTKAYIATQGPLDNTVGDFWRMIWETESRVIVMLTKEIENDRVKCAKYWTDEQPLTIGNLMITYHSQPEQTSALIIRKFKLTNSENGEERVITQFQYIGWPDHGLPISTEEFLDLAKRADKANLSRAPLIVHCSAGLGRSGTFIIIHMILAMIKYERRSYPDQEPLINIPEVLIHLRKSRKGMIQTEEQYLFCFLCISDGIAEITSKKKESDYVEFSFIRQKLLQEAPQTDNDKAD